MKTINVPLIGDCPKWNDEIPPQGMDELRVRIAQVHQDVAASAARSMITDAEPRRWHGTLFSSFAPIPYYAGEFRGEYPERPCLATDVGVSQSATLVIVGTHYRQVTTHVLLVIERASRHLTRLEFDWPQLSPRDRAYRLAAIIANLVGGFIQIHPFVNGNGRTSRFLWRWCLFRFGVSSQCRIYPRPSQPYGDMMGHAMRGNYRPLVLHVLAHLQQNSPAQN